MGNRILIIALAFALGLLARELGTTSAHADEQALQRQDVQAIVRALDGQVRATRELRDAVQDAGRRCGK